MPSKTIAGCVNFSTGDVIFEGEACDGGDYTGCMVWTGVHAGQVAVTIDEPNCDDTYYGCVDFSTGEFKIEIPENCCTCYCTDVAQFSVTFTGIQDCTGWSACAAGQPSTMFNGTHILNIATPSCLWVKTWTVSSDVYHVALGMSDLNVQIEAHIGTIASPFYCYAFYFWWVEYANCHDVMYNERGNELECGECEEPYGYDGSVSWEPVIP